MNTHGVERPLADGLQKEGGLCCGLPKERLQEVESLPNSGASSLMSEIYDKQGPATYDQN